MSYYDPNQQPPPPEYTQYPQQQTGPGIPPPPQYYPTGGLPPQYPIPPQQQLSMPPQQPPHLPLWAIFVMIAIVALVGASIVYGLSKGSSTTTTANTVLSGAQVAATNSAQLAATNGVSTVDTTSTQPASSNSAHFKAGDTASTPDGFIVTVLKTYTSSGGQYDTPSAGNQYLIVDVSVKNATGQVQHMAENQFTLTDSTGQRIDSTYVSMDGIHEFVGGTLQDGSIMRGQLAYEVPKGNHPYQYTFMGNMFGDFQTTWDIHS